MADILTADAAPTNGFLTLELKKRRPPDQDQATSADQGQSAGLSWRRLVSATICFTGSEDFILASAAWAVAR
jgi:hypothetical protein